MIPELPKSGRDACGCRHLNVWKHPVTDSCVSQENHWIWTLTEVAGTSWRGQNYNRPKRNHYHYLDHLSVEARLCSLVPLLFSSVLFKPQVWFSGLLSYLSWLGVAVEMPLSAAEAVPQRCSLLFWRGANESAFHPIKIQRKCFFFVSLLRSMGPYDFLLSYTMFHSFFVV